MRVIAGTYRSRPLSAPPGLATRPTTDRLRETLFNVLTNGAEDRIAGAHVLDLYAGSGLVGIEAISRGAAQVTFVESNAVAMAALRKNLETLSIRMGYSAESRSVASFLKRESGKAVPAGFDVIFLDPPWDLAAEYEQTLSMLGGEAKSMLAPAGIVIAEHRKTSEPAESYGTLTRTRLLAQGDAGLSFYATR